jgi:hypothetical protein
VKIAGWPATKKEVWTGDGLAMSFLSLEDETALLSSPCGRTNRHSNRFTGQSPRFIGKPGNTKPSHSTKRMYCFLADSQALSTS